MLSYVNTIYPDILHEFWIHELWNSQILAKMKFSQITVNLQYVVAKADLCLG